MGDVTVVTGMVLSSMPISDYDKRIVLITKERGKIAAFAKGARRMNSHLMGVTQPFSFGTFELYEGRATYNIKQASISNYFSEVTSNLEAVYYGCYFAEIADYFSKENLDGSGMINLLYSALKALTNDNIPNELIRYVYELKAMVLNGEYPKVFQCANCGSKEELMIFSISTFGMYCKNCKNTPKDGIAISQSSLYTLQYIISSKIDKLFTFTVSEDVLAELRMVLGRLRSVVFDRPMKSLEMLLLVAK